MENGLLLSDSDQQIRRNNANGPDIYLNSPLGADISVTTVRVQKF